MTSTLDELERAVERLTAVSNVNPSCPGWIVARQDDLRLLLSERAELLAAVERMRGGLEKIAAYYPPGHRVEELARAALTTGEDTTPNAGERG